MDGVTGASIAKLVGEGGIYGLGWVLFIFMMFREVRERKRYSDLVIHIISYFTKVNMVERHDNGIPLVPESFFEGGHTRRGKRATRQNTDSSDDES